MKLTSVDALRAVASMALVPLALAMAGGRASADVLLSDFNNFNYTGSYVSWATPGAITPGPTSVHVAATNSGGAFFNESPAIAATTESLLEVKFDVNPNDAAHVFNVVLVDGDGTERVFRYRNLSIGPSQTLTRNLLVHDEDLGWLQDNNPGSTPGLNIANIVAFHTQGTFASTAALDLNFDNLALKNVPEPSTVVLAGMAAIAGLFIARRRAA